MRHSRVAAPVVAGAGGTGRAPGAPGSPGRGPGPGPGSGPGAFGRSGAPPLVAVAHGSRDPRAARTVEELMAGVRTRAAVREISPFPVLTAYLDHACPSPGQVLTGLAEAGHDTVVVLPLLLTAAYHSKIDLPEVLRGVRQSHPRLAVRYGSTLGPDPLLRDAVLRRLGEAGVSPAPGTAVVLTAAGSSDPAAARTIERLAASLHDGGRAGTGWHSVLPAYASAAEPDPATAVAMARSAGASRVVVAPYLLAPGHFADRVRERTLAAGADVVTPVLGPAPELAEIVLRRYDEALSRRLVAAAG